MNKMDRNEMVHQIVGIEAMLENGLFEDPTEEQKLQKEKESLERKVRLMDIQELLEEAEDDQEKAELLSEKEKLDLQEELEQLKGKTVYAYIAAPDKILLRKFTVDDLFLVRGEKMVAVGYFHFPLKLIGGITTATEWRRIHCTTWKKLAYLFTFPVFMLSYVPIVIQSLFVTPEWTPIRHTRALSARQICGEIREDAG